MIKANELRIGNWVIANGLYEGAVLKVDAITVAGSLRDEMRVVLFEGKEVGEFSKDLEGIPITHEILEKGGVTDSAKNNAGRRLYLNSTDELCWYRQDNSLRYQTRGSGFTRDFNIKYVHQLQNLYFVLTEIELPITPTLAEKKEGEV